MTTIMEIVYPDNSKIVGSRGFWEIGFPFPRETKGTHHFRVLKESDKQYQHLVGKEIAVPISSAKYFVICK
jgi:hypothetical protein